MATGMIGGAGRVEFATPFTARLQAVTVTFYHSATGEPLSNVLRLWQAVKERQLTHHIQAFEMPPTYLVSTLQSVLSWLSLWLAMGLTVILLRRPLTTTLWWQIGGMVGCLFIWRLLQAISVSHWLWLPNGQPTLVDAISDMLVKMTLGATVPSALLWAFLWRALFWLLTGTLFFISLFFVVRSSFRCSKLTALLSVVITYIAARWIYALATWNF